MLVLGQKIIMISNKAVLKRNSAFSPRFFFKTALFDIMIILCPRTSALYVCVVVFERKFTVPEPVAFFGKFTVSETVAFFRKIHCPKEFFRQLNIGAQPHFSATNLINIQKCPRIIFHLNNYLLLYIRRDGSRKIFV